MLAVCAWALLAPAARAIGPRDDVPSERKIVFGPQRFSFERVGTFTYVHCQPKDSPDCSLFEKLEIQPVLDWDDFAAKVKKARQLAAKKRQKPRVLAKENGVDQHGGLWLFAQLPGGVVVVPAFKAYDVSFDDDGGIKDVEVVSR